jgi:hypothetical protein
VTASIESDAVLRADPAREEVHFRQIDMRAFRRSDALFEIEARVVDRKPRDLPPAPGARFVRANEPLHDLGLRLVFDEDLLVHAIEPFTTFAPYPVCPEGGRELQSVVGLKMTGGWGREVRNRLSGARSCTHLMELLTPVATTAHQALRGFRTGRPEPTDANGRPAKIDSCYAFRANGEVVLRRWPDFYRPKPGEIKD